MKYFGDTFFNDLLSPSIAADATIKNSGAAINGNLEKLARAIPDLLLFARLASDSGLEKPVSMLAPLERLAALSNGLKALPEDVLDLLAWQLHVERYETAASLSAKKAMVFNSVILHRKRGTAWAVRHGLETSLQVPARVEEWFGYGGEPYYFRVYLDVSGKAINAKDMDDAVKVIFAHKNVRSWLEFLQTVTTRKLPLRIRAGAVNYTKSRLFAWVWPVAYPELKTLSGAGLAAISVTRAAPVNRLPVPGALRFHVYKSCYSFTSTRIQSGKYESN